MSSWFLGARIAFVVFASQALSVRGGESVEIPWSRGVARASAATGEVIGWQGDVVRWRAPAVCAAARTVLYVQAADGTEERIALDVAPAAGRLEPLVVVEGESPGVWDLQSGSGADVSFAVSVGVVEALPRVGSCSLARWRLPEARRPDWAVAAAFRSDGELSGWRVLARSSARVQEVEAAPGTRVLVSIAGRLYAAVAGRDRIARVPIEVPPGIAVAQVLARGKTIPHALSPPPLTVDHGVEGPGGSRWIFRVDERGLPDDGHGVPEGFVRVSTGAYRSVPLVDAPADVRRETPPEISPGARSDASLAAPPDAPSASSSALRDATPVASVVESLPPIRAQALPTPDTANRAIEGAWRLALGAHLGPSTRRGIGGSLGRSWRASSWIEPGLGVAALVSGVRHRRIDAEGLIQHETYAGALWAEAALLHRLGPVWGALAPGAGWAASRRESTIERAPPELRTASGPLVTASVRIGLGPVDMEGRALWSTAPLRSDHSQLGWLLGLSWVSSRPR